VGAEARDGREHLAAAFYGRNERKTLFRLALENVPHVLGAEGNVPRLVSMRQARERGGNGIGRVLAQKLEKSEEGSFAHHTQQERGGRQCGASDGEACRGQTYTAAFDKACHIWMLPLAMGRLPERGIPATEKQSVAEQENY